MAETETRSTYEDGYRNQMRYMVGAGWDEGGAKGALAAREATAEDNAYNRGGTEATRDFMFGVRPKPAEPRTCQVCGGRVHRRGGLTLRRGYEDTTQPFLHDRDEDWRDNPHNVVINE